jgi:glutamyl-tRNA synthetase
MDDAELARRTAARVRSLGGDPESVELTAVVALLKDRAETLVQLAQGAMLFCGPFTAAPAELAATHLTETAREALGDFAARAADVEWTRESLAALIKTVLADRGMKMPQLAIPLRVAITGQTQTPAIDAVLALLGRERVLERLSKV